jgi:hypothetical protein
MSYKIFAVAVFRNALRRVLSTPFPRIDLRDSCDLSTSTRSLTLRVLKDCSIQLTRAYRLALSN